MFKVHGGNVVFFLTCIIFAFLYPHRPAFVRKMVVISTNLSLFNILISRGVVQDGGD